LQGSTLNRAIVEFDGEFQEWGRFNINAMTTWPPYGNTMAIDSAYIGGKTEDHSAGLHPQNVDDVGVSS
jgi:hypothetical protein